MSLLSDSIENRLLALKVKTPAEIAALEASRKAQANAETITSLKLGWNAPSRHLKAAVAFNGPWGDVFTALRDKLGTGFMVVLYGTNGNGKTQLAVELMRHQVEQRVKSARFATAMEFFMEVKATYRSDAQRGEEQVVEAFCKPRFLVVDEAEKRSESAWENNLLFHVANARYNDEKDTLLISNLERADLEAHLGRSLVSRLNETGGMIHCDWPSRR